MQIKPIGEWINIPNYSDKSRQIGNVDLRLGRLQINLVLRIRTIVRGKSQDLYNVYDDFGFLLCTTDEEGWETIQEYIGEYAAGPRQPVEKIIINTYTIAGKAIRMNNTQYIQVGTESRITPIRINNTNYYQCYSFINTPMFITDEEGYDYIIKGGGDAVLAMPNPFEQ